MKRVVMSLMTVLMIMTSFNAVYAQQNDKISRSLSRTGRTPVLLAEDNPKEPELPMEEERPLITSVSHKSTGVKITWIRDPQATGYEIWRSGSLEGTYTRITTIKKGSTVTCTDKKVKNSKTYFYKIRVIYKKDDVTSYSEFSQPRLYYRFPKPAKLTVKANDLYSIKLSWSAVSKATSYGIWRSPSKNGTYELLTTVNGTSYVDETVTTGKKYYYRVSAIITVGEYSYGRMSSKVSGSSLLPKTSITSATVVEVNQVRLTFKEVTDGEQYAVYRSTSKSKNYKLIATVDVPEYLDEDRIPGKTYYYKVRVTQFKGVKVTGTLSSYKKVKIPALKAPTIREITQPLFTSSLTVKFNRTNGQKYEIYCSVGNKKNFKKVGTTVSDEFTYAGKAGKTCYFKVRAVMTVNGKNHYSSFGPIVSKKIAKAGTISLVPTVFPMVKGKTFRISLDDPTPFIYESANEVICTVENGIITAHETGDCEVYIFNKDRTQRAVLTIRVYEAFQAGIDVSSWQGDRTEEDWQAAKQDGVDFVMIREGFRCLPDRCFEDNYENAKKAGIHVGAYHYLNATTVKETREEARSMLNNLAGKSFEYPIALDIEEKAHAKMSAAELNRLISTFCGEIEAAGYQVVIYSYAALLKKVDSDNRSRYGLWVANWDVVELNPVFAEVPLWQYTSDGRVAGFEGRMDLNISYFDYPSHIRGNHRNGY